MNAAAEKNVSPQDADVSGANVSAAAPEKSPGPQEISPGPREEKPGLESQEILEVVGDAARGHMERLNRFHRAVICGLSPAGADEALYQAKGSGRNRVSFWSEDGDDGNDAG